MPAEVKLIEVRDEGTTIVCIALKPHPETEAERWGWARTGYGLTPGEQGTYVLLGPLGGGHGLLTCDPFKHPGAPTQRTLWAAHTWLKKNWHLVQSGDVVDVEFIMGVSDHPKRPEREETG
jgi:hypothetical protein